MRVWNLGYPRIGRKRELKTSLESYWAGNLGRDDFLADIKKLCALRWGRQHELGVESIPINDFSFYDHVLDMAFCLGIIPERFKKISGRSWLDRYFAMARGHQDKGTDLSPLEMTKWFNTNYHYLVPEISREMEFKLCLEKVEFECEHTRSFPYLFHPVIVGPYTLVRLSRLSGLNVNEALLRLVSPYRVLLQEFKHRNFPFVQVDEPALGLGLSQSELEEVGGIYDKLSSVGISLKLVTYFSSPEPLWESLARFSVEGIHWDLLYGGGTQSWLEKGNFPSDKTLSVGLVDGRNVWLTPLEERLKCIENLCYLYGEEKLWIAPSCSLIHLPIDKTLEKRWDRQFLTHVSFADQRLEELLVLKKAHLGDASAKSRVHTVSLLLKGKPVDFSASIDTRDVRRRGSYEERLKSQKDVLGLPLLPTSTVGSFPQTSKVRSVRNEYKKGMISQDAYESFLKEEIESVVKLQERIGLDVLVHGESERSDMVEFFAQDLDGFRISSYGWVQSYGSRSAKPPLIFGDVKRKSPMTVSWFKYAQSLTPKPMKAILTGPVTLMHWSFVREDQPPKQTAFQIARALSEEVADLERAGAKIIQIDEAAFREALPLKKEEQQQYLVWATEAFRMCSRGVSAQTQIQTHMCYSDFEDIAFALEWLDADVLLIEFARSGSMALKAFEKNRYSRAIGPGVYDIHSPRIPTESECEGRILELVEVFGAERLWINPDCGLKTRQYAEIEPALIAMVKAARKMRTQMAGRMQ